MRESLPGPFEVFLMERSRGNASFLVSHVFPGGKLESVDNVYAQNHLENHHWSNFASAAIRETAEEIGVFLVENTQGLVPNMEEATSLCAQLRAGSDFYEILSEKALSPAFSMLSPFAWWITPEIEPRRYDTRFFLALMPPQDIDLDPSEASGGTWFAPSDALAAFERGEIFLLPPTSTCLEVLACATSLNDASNLAHFETAICPQVALDANGNPMLVIPGDSCYEGGPRVPTTRTRFYIPTK